MGCSHCITRFAPPALAARNAAKSRVSFDLTVGSDRWPKGKTFSTACMTQSRWYIPRKDSDHKLIHSCRINQGQQKSTVISLPSWSIHCKTRVIFEKHSNKAFGYVGSFNPNSMNQNYSDHTSYCDSDGDVTFIPAKLKLYDWQLDFVKVIKIWNLPPQSTLNLKIN